MKNRFIVFFSINIFMFITVSCVKPNLEEIKPLVVPKSWHKISLNIQDDFKKILVCDNEVLIFSREFCYASKDLKNWEKRLVPDRYSFSDYSDEPFVVMFKDRLYIDAKDGLYYSNDGARTWNIGFETRVNAVTADENWLYIFHPSGSYRSSDGINFESLDELNLMIKPIPWRQDIYFMFAKADSEQIILSGIWDTGMQYELISNNQGLTWKKFTSISINDFCDSTKVFMNSFGGHFYVSGSMEMEQLGGIFWTLDKFNNDYYFAGKTNYYYFDGLEIERGIIVKNDNFDSAFVCPEVIRELEIIRGKPTAIGDDSAFYVLE